MSEQVQNQNQQPVANIAVSLQDIQILNNIISNSSPTLPFAVVTQFVAGINKQLQEQLKEAQPAEGEDAEKPAKKRGGLTKV